MSKDKCWKSYLSSLREKTCAEDKLRDTKTKIFIIEYNCYCTRRHKVKKIETQQVKVELLTMQTSMYRDVHESSCRGESSSNDNEDECNAVKDCCDGDVG